MYFLLVVAFILLDADGIASENNLNSTLTQDALELDMTRLNRSFADNNSLVWFLSILSIEEMVAIDQKFSLTHWEYNEQCRATLEYYSYPICKSPMMSYHRDTYCFDTRIKYNYTTTIYMEFPQHLEILSGFPRCWSQFSPLLCSAYYRPCVLKKRMAKPNVSESWISPNTLEFWEVYPTVFCTHAKQECEFLVKMDLWPDFLNCEETIESSKLGKILPRYDWNEHFGLYNKECKVNYREAPIKPKIHPCIWPLAAKSSNDVIVNAKPLIDDCYLPCRSSSHNIYDMKVVYFFAALGLALGFAAWVFLVWFSKVYEDHFSVFLLSNALFSGLVYTTIVTLPYFDAVFESTVCTDNGRIRITPPKIDFSKSGGFREAMSICTFSSWLLTSSFISLNAWIADFIIHFILGTSRKRDYEFPIKTVQRGQNPRLDPCRLHQLSIYLCALFYSLFNFFFIDIPTDGQLGICYYGLGDITRIFIVYGPIYLMAFIVLVTFIWKQVNRKLPGKPPEVTTNSSSRADQSMSQATTTETQREYQSQPREVYVGNRNWLKTSKCLSKLCRNMSLAYFLYILLSIVSQYFLFWHKILETEEILDKIRCSLYYALSPSSRIKYGWSWSWLSYSFECNLYSKPGMIVRISTVLYVFLYPALPLIVAILWLFKGCVFKTQFNESLSLIRKNIIPCTGDKTNDYIELEPLQGFERSANHNRNRNDFASQQNSEQRPMINNYQCSQANGTQLRRCASCEVLWAVQTPLSGQIVQMPRPNTRINFVYHLK
ncbi:protein smoothened [Ditylenchus destructor]|uniref:Protein smoothened n=1 Tax=Ditylenchus destructor TaxID=166010 RepID=A0AAD4MRP0_9BILA|nr:protein smoothened [Ditylenchus destructor]